MNNKQGSDESDVAYVSINNQTDMHMDIDIPFLLYSQKVMRIFIDF